MVEENNYRDIELTNFPGIVISAFVGSAMNDNKDYFEKQINF